MVLLCPGVGELVTVPSCRWTSLSNHLGFTVVLWVPSRVPQFPSYCGAAPPRGPPIPSWPSPSPGMGTCPTAQSPGLGQCLLGTVRQPSKAPGHQAILRGTDPEGQGLWIGVQVESAVLSDVRNELQKTCAMCGVPLQGTWAAPRLLFQREIPATKARAEG